jgi:hypothetical protein
MCESNECPVCYETVDLIKFHCEHYLDYACYNKLVVKKCPMCRTDLVDLSLVGSINYYQNVCEFDFQSLYPSLLLYNYQRPSIFDTESNYGLHNNRFENRSVTVDGIASLNRLRNLISRPEEIPYKN